MPPRPRSTAHTVGPFGPIALDLVVGVTLDGRGPPCADCNSTSLRASSGSRSFRVPDWRAGFVASGRPCGAERCRVPMAPAVADRPRGCGAWRSEVRLAIEPLRGLEHAPLPAAPSLGSPLWLEREAHVRGDVEFADRGRSFWNTIAMSRSRPSANGLDHRGRIGDQESAPRRGGPRVRELAHPGRTCGPGGPHGTSTSAVGDLEWLSSFDGRSRRGPDRGASQVSYCKPQPTSAPSHH